MQHKKIVFLASDCESSRWVYNSLKNDLNIEAAIIETPVSKKTLIKGRLKRIGLFKVMGQVMFTVLIVPVLRWKAQQRKAALIKEYGLNNDDITGTNIYRVNSVNDNDCLVLLKQINPGLVIVNGTRIISKKILQSVDAMFLNMHVGITPQYRGSHGGYWAIRNNDKTNFGTTIHLVDAGVDTGAVIKQVFVTPGEQDNFTTYPVLQAAAGINALKEVLTGIEAGKNEFVSHTEKGKMYFQPTLWEYLTGKAK